MMTPSHIRALRGFGESAPSTPISAYIVFGLAGSGLYFWGLKIYELLKKKGA